MDDLARSLRALVDAAPPVTAAEVEARAAEGSPAPGDPRRRLLVGAAALVAAALLVAGALALRAGPDGEPVRTHRPPSSTVPRVVEREGVPLLEGHTPGAGTPLRDGLVVPDGAALIGPVFPITEGMWTAEVTRWDALLVVTGPPSQVVAELAAQGEALGAEAATGCESFAHGPPGGASETCSGALRWPDGRAVQIDLERREASAPGADGRRTPALSHLSLVWRDESSDPTSFVPSEPVPVDDLPPPRWWAPLARPGEPLRPAHAGLRSEGGRVVLPPGVAEVGPLWSTGEIIRSVLLVTGEPEAAMADLASGIVAAYSVAGEAHAEAPTSAERDGLVLRRQVVSYDLSGYVLTGVTRPGGPSYLIVDQYPLD